MTIEDRMTKLHNEVHDTITPQEAVRVKQALSTQGDSTWRIMALLNHVFRNDTHLSTSEALDKIRPLWEAWNEAGETVIELGDKIDRL